MHTNYVKIRLVLASLMLTIFSGNAPAQSTGGSTTVFSDNFGTNGDGTNCGSKISEADMSSQMGFDNLNGGDCRTPNDGNYSVVCDGASTVGCQWLWHDAFNDQTTGDVNGNMVIINDGYNTEFYRKTLTNLCPSTPYTVTFYLANLADADISGACGGAPLIPNIEASAYAVGGTSGGTTQSYGNLNATSNLTWVLYTFSFTTDAGQTSADIVLKDLTSAGCGNDLAFDGFKITGINSLASLNAAFATDTSKGCAPLQVAFTNTSLGGKSFTWAFGDGSTLSTGTASSVSHTYSDPGTYPVMLVATDLTTCLGTDTAFHTINVYRINPSAVSASFMMCAGDSVQLDAGADPYYTYSWNPSTSLSNPTVYNPYSSAMQTIIYHVTLTDTNNCSAVLSDTVIVSNIVKEGSTAKNISDCRGLPKMEFQNISSGPLNYLWDFGDGQTSSEQNPVHEYQNFGTYTVTVKVYNNYCNGGDTLSFTIPQIKYPNLITPNGDSLNDQYVIEGNPGEWRLDLYNRWGEVVFKSQDYKNNWDADGLNTGIYYYLITTPAKVQCKGWVHVIK